MPNITVLNGEEIGKTYSWTADQIRIGRNQANDFVIVNASVSGEHCIIEKCEDGWRVKDLDSTNGTKLNDQRISMAMLHRDDVVTLGDIALSLRGDDLPEADPGYVEAAESIPRTTIVMRPTAAAAAPVEGFAKKSESKKALNVILTIVIIAILGVAAVLILMLLGIL